MLKKLLKYDFIAVYKYWWFAALAAFIVSLLGSVCMSLLDIDNLPDIVAVMLSLIMFFVVISHVIFYLTAIILVYLRFYRNFFTDEGYLTFTLPVKRSQLLNAKLILYIFTVCLTALLSLLSIILMCFIGFRGDIQKIDILVSFIEYIQSVITKTGSLTPLYILILLIKGCLSIGFSGLLFFFCITFASMVAKKDEYLPSSHFTLGSTAYFP